MRVLHVIDVAAPVGGTQTYLHGITAMLLAAGHDVAIVHGDGEAEVPEGVFSAEVGSKSLDRQLAAFAPDVMHVHGPLLPPELEALVRQVPCVRALHDFGFACSSGSKYFRDGSVCRRAHGPGCLLVGLPRGCGHRLDVRPFLAQYRRVTRDLALLRGASAVVVHSRFVRDVARANGLPTDSLAVVPYYVPRNDEPAPRAGSRTLLFAGRVVPDKGLDLLIEALALAPGAWDELLVAGEGWDLQRCRRLAGRRGIESSVAFLGHRPIGEVRAAMRQARVVVVPSRWPEPFGIVGLEAMAEARPVVASRVGGIPEWLDDGETGLLVDSGDAEALGRAIRELLGAPDRAEEMGQEGWRRVARFSAKAHVDALVSLYERVADRHPAAAQALGR